MIKQVFMLLILIKKSNYSFLFRPDIIILSNTQGAHMKNFLALALGAFVLYPAFASAATCTDTIKAVKESRSGFDNPNRETFLNMTYLNQNLGQAATKTLTQQKYTWGNYQIVVRAGKTIMSQGVEPEAIKNKNQGQFMAPLPTLEEATQLLGQPQAGPVETLTEYTWACQDTSSSLQVTTDPSNKIIEYSGSLCSTATNCTYFSGGF
jgi:hypothetical protein